MAEQQQDPLTEDELASLSKKLTELSGQLSPKEKWFLTESLKSGIMANNASDVQGYTVGSALGGGTLYYPESYSGKYGAGQTIGDAEKASFPTISIKVTVKF